MSQEEETTTASTSSTSSSSKRSGELASLRDFFSYNTFVRRKYLNFVSTLPEETLARDRGASFPTILDIMTHVLDVYRCWLRACETGEACKRWVYKHETGKDLPELFGLSLAEITKIEEEVDAYVDRFMQKLKAEDLDRSFQYTIGNGKNARVVTRNTGEMLWHLIEEELQHRGELNALLWQENIDPPVTSWYEWKRVSVEKSNIP